jgi:outer membrane protein assembly factor BamB
LNLHAQPRAADRVDTALHIAALDPRWTLAFEVAPAAPAGFDANAAYVPLKSGELVCVDLERGEIRWKVALVTAHTPAAGDGLVFAADDGVVVAFEDRTGKTSWRTPIEGPLAAPVFFDAGFLLVAKSDGEVIGLRAQDGMILWRHTLNAAPVVAPAASGDRLFVGLKGGQVAALDRDTGQPLWTVGVSEDATGLLALENQLVVGTRANRMLSLDLQRGRTRWDWRVGADVTGAAVADDRRIYFAARDNMLRALDRGNGNLRWKRSLPSRTAGGPLRTGDVVIMPTVAADVPVYWAETGEPAFVIQTAGELAGVPYLREGQRQTATRLVLITREGTLQGFAARFEAPPAALNQLPGGAKVGQ